MSRLILSRKEGESIAVYDAQARREEPDFYITLEKINRQRFEADVIVGEGNLKTVAINRGDIFHISPEGMFADRANSALAFSIKRKGSSWTRGVQFVIMPSSERYVFERVPK